MTAVLRAELIKLTRPRILIATAVAVLIAAAIATVVVFLSAADAGSAPRGRGTDLATLAGAGGATEAFSVGMSLMGFFAFVLFTVNWAAEFSQGTFRTVLMKHPGRLSLLAGKLLGLLAFAAAVLLASLAAVWCWSLVMASIRDVPTDAWFSLAGLREAAGNYANALFGAAAWASFGMALAMALRSTPLALAAGIAWAGPFEHITQQAWGAVSGWYPGLLLEAFVVGGTSDVSYVRALTLLVAYGTLAVSVAALSFARRDITAT